MIINLGHSTDTHNFQTDLVIVGAGPAGIVLALEAAARGISAILLESGYQHFDAKVQDLSCAAHYDPNTHAPPTLTIRRQLGGTSVIWGGRCVPYDPVDFLSRPFIANAYWPIDYDQLTQYFQRACDWMQCGRDAFSITLLPHLPPTITPRFVDGPITASSLERWSLPTNFGTLYEPKLRVSKRLTVLTGVTCTAILCRPGSGIAEAAICATQALGTVQVNAKAIVVACGGLETTRLLLSSVGPQGETLGNRSGHLGKWYMAHVEGSIANVRFFSDPRTTIYDYERDTDGVYVRRRFGFTSNFQLLHELPNVVAWLANPEPSDANHLSGPLSFVYLALSSPLGPRFAPDALRLALTGIPVPGTPYRGAHVTSRRSHARNIIRQPLSTARFITTFGTRRFLTRSRRAPGFFLPNKDNVYLFQYHGEHRPNPHSRVELDRQTDRLGRQMLNISLRFSTDDVDGIIRAHKHWDAYLRGLNVGQLEYLVPNPSEVVAEHLGGGFHQLGTTRMASCMADGVVDRNLTVFGTPNVYVLSSSTFPTSGQANSTFMIIVFALRLAEHLADRLNTRAGTIPLSPG